MASPAFVRELIIQRSAHANGPATTVKRGKSLTYVNLGRKNLSSPRPQNLLVTWEWISEKNSESRGRKRSQPDPSEISSSGVDGEQDEPEDGLKLWGYMPGHVHYNLNRVDGEDSPKKGSPTESDKSDEVEGVLYAIPPRSITGIDKDTGIEGLAEFDIEIRRRIWTLLYIWDWQMSAWLGRPHLIDQKDVSFEFPNLRLDQSASEPNLLSPFAHMALQAQIARRIAPLMGDIQVISDLSTDQVSAVLNEMREYIRELPPVFRVEDPDRSLDERHPYYVFQRHQLHVVTHMTMLDFLKPYLARDPRKPKTPRDEELRKTGVGIALKLLGEARLLFDHEYPINAKFHMIVFAIFDTSTILCSAIIHDVDNVLPHREEVISAIESTLDMLQQLSYMTKLGASSYWFLLKLVQAAPVLSQYAPINKRQRRLQKFESTKSGSDVRTPLPQQTLPTTIAPVIEPEVKEAAPALDPLPVPEIATTDDLSFDLDQFLAQNPWGNSSNLDIGGMEVVWDWDDLNLDFSLMNNESTGNRPSEPDH
ncbi:hypothetical protein N0V90_008058 [Kalmusia sp. IMI 367209]|nr:hypothetical protein N0V90_008058 [Kalmusia sp. IMI 367209]